jgi:hypothetical protein
MEERLLVAVVIHFALRGYEQDFQGPGGCWVRKLHQVKKTGLIEKTMTLYCRNARICLGRQAGFQPVW